MWRSRLWCRGSITLPISSRAARLWLLAVKQTGPWKMSCLPLCWRENSKLYKNISLSLWCLCVIVPLPFRGVAYESVARSSFRCRIHQACSCFNSSNIGQLSSDTGCCLPGSVLHTDACCVTGVALQKQWGRLRQKKWVMFLSFARVVVSWPTSGPPDQKGSLI